MALAKFQKTFMPVGQKENVPIVQLLLVERLSCLTQEPIKYKSVIAMSRCWFGNFWLSLSPSSSQSMICCMPVSPFPFKGRILPCNPSQLWQIARPIKGKLFGSAQTRWPHVAARPPLHSAFIPPGTSPLRVQGSRSLWVLPQWSGEENMETADKQDN